MGTSWQTIGLIVKENMNYKSYVLKMRHLLWWPELYPRYRQISSRLFHARRFEQGMNSEP